MTEKELENLEEFYSNEDMGYSQWGERAWLDVPMLTSEIEKLRTMLKNVVKLSSGWPVLQHHQDVVKAKEYLEQTLDLEEDCEGCDNLKSECQCVYCDNCNETEELCECTRCDVCNGNLELHGDCECEELD